MYQKFYFITTVANNDFYHDTLVFYDGQYPAHNQCIKRGDTFRSGNYLKNHATCNNSIISTFSHKIIISVVVYQNSTFKFV